MRRASHIQFAEIDTWNNLTEKQRVEVLGYILKQLSQNPKNTQELLKNLGIRKKFDSYIFHAGGKLLLKALERYLDPEL